MTDRCSLSRQRTLTAGSMGHRGRDTRLACANGLLTRQKAQPPRRHLPPTSHPDGVAHMSSATPSPPFASLSSRSFSLSHRSLCRLFWDGFSQAAIVQHESSDRAIGEEDEGHSKEPGMCEGPPQDGSVHHELPVSSAAPRPPSAAAAQTELGMKLRVIYSIEIK